MKPGYAKGTQSAETSRSALSKYGAAALRSVSWTGHCRSSDTVATTSRLAWHSSGAAFAGILRAADPGQAAKGWGASGSGWQMPAACPLQRGVWCRVVRPVSCVPGAA